jgi:hypothetical protein
MIKHWVGGEILQGGLNQPAAMKTDFGWFFLGPNPTKEVDEKAFNFSVVEDELTTSLRNDINRMFRYDFLVGQVKRQDQK